VFLAIYNNINNEDVDEDLDIDEDEEEPGTPEEEGKDWENIE